MERRVTIGASTFFNAELNKAHPPSEQPQQNIFVGLSPAAVKLTAVDAQRIISAFETAIRRSELMACLEDTIRRSVPGGPLCISLGYEIVAQLEQYQRVLDVHVDVTSWRRLTVYDLRLPPVIAEALLRTSCTDLTGPHGDNFDQNLLLDFMLKFDSTRAASDPDIPSVLDLQFSETSSHDFFKNLISGSDLTHEVESEHRRSSTANVTALKTDSLSPAALGRRKSSGNENTKKNLNDELKPKYFDADPEYNSSEAVKVTSPSRRSPKEITLRPVVSGSDINYALHRQHSSISSFVEQDSEQHCELSYPAGGFDLEDSVTNIGERVDQTPSTFDYSRFMTATRKLDIVKRDMAAWCRHLMRSFRCRPVAMDTVLSGRHMPKNIEKYIEKLKELKNHFLNRLLTTPLEELEKTEYINELLRRITELGKLEEKLQVELEHETKLKNDQIGALDDIIDAYVRDLTLTQHLSTEFIRRTREDAIKQQRSDSNNSSIRQAKGVNAVIQLKGQLIKARQEFWIREAAQRKIKYKLEEDIFNRISRYDVEMTSLQDEYDEVAAQYKIEKAQLDELEILFIPLNEEYQLIMAERADIHRAQTSAKREENRRQMSAFAIQAWWRAYRVRKANAKKVKLNEKRAKKLAKIAAKKAKIAAKLAKLAEKQAKVTQKADM